MPETLFNKDFSAGWCPSDDAVNGRPNALLAMDNLELDRNGALKMVGGTNILYGPYSGSPHTMFSRYIGNTRCDYAACSDGSIYRNNTSIASGGDATNAAFSTAFNFTLICSGAKRYKDNGSSLVNLGVLPPTQAPVVTQNAINAPWQLIGNMQTNVNVTNGTMTVVSGNYDQCTTDATGVFAMQTNPYPVSPFNCTVLNGPAGTGTSTDDDLVIINGYIAYPYGVGLQFDVLLENVTQPTNFYTYSVSDLSTQAEFDPVSGLFTLRIPRSSFVIAGSGAKDWSTVYGFRLTVNVGQAVATTFNIWGMYFGQSFFLIKGGTGAQFGTYQYAQVNVNNTGSYIAKSILGPLSNPITIEGNTALITAQDPTVIDPQCNEAWIFRTGGNLGGKWYRVLVIRSSYTTPVYDNMGDQAALDLNITIDINLISIAAATVSDKILDIIGPIQGRWYYFTVNFMYPSEVNDPDLVNASLAVRLCGSSSELLMWARAVSASVVIVGTSIDCYLLTGTFSTFPDGTVDVYYQSLGVKFPPVSFDAAAYGGSIYYRAADGWRMLVPTSFGTTYANQNNQLIVSPNLDRLYNGETCYGYTPPAPVVQPGLVRFPVTIVKNKLWCSITGTGRFEVYDFVRQYWYTFNYGLQDASACCATQDNKIIASFPNDGKARELDYSGSKLIDGAAKQKFNVQFTYKDNGRPRQRKDTYTFKSRCAPFTGSILVTIVDEKNDSFTIPTALAAGGANPTELFVDLSAPLSTNYPKSYMVSMQGQSDDVIIEDWSIDYDARPIPVTFLRFTATNYGTTARKRIYTVPFQVDSLGNPIQIQAYVDGVTYPVLNVNSIRRQSFDYQFLCSQFGNLGNQTVGRDFEWTVNGGGKEFEWYDFQQIRNMEVFPDPRACYIIPKTNFGQPVQKRFRTWPFVIDTRGNDVTFTAYVDNVPDGVSVFNTNGERATVFHYFTTDVFGIDYGGIFSDPAGLMEIWAAPGLAGAGDSGIMPDSVQNLPIMHKYDQVGPLEIFRWGKVVKMALRCFSNGTPIPFKVFMSDNNVWSGNFNVTPGIEDEYMVDVPKGTSGRIIRVELGPCSFTFARYFMKFQVAISAAQKDTELQWITIPGLTSQLSAGI